MGGSELEVLKNEEKPVWGENMGGCNLFYPEKEIEEEYQIETTVNLQKNWLMECHTRFYMPKQQFVWSGGSIDSCGIGIPSYV